MQFGFYFDQTRCIHCNACSVACKDWKEIKPGNINPRRVTVKEVGAFPSMRFQVLSMGCNHCAEPSCLIACQAGAITKRPEDGIVIVDRSACQNFRTCLAVCPYGAPQFGTDDDEPVTDESWVVDHPMIKCDFCVDRLAKGQQPICVAACPQRALDCGDMAVLKKKYSDALSNESVMPHSKYDPFGNVLAKDTKPSLLIRKR